MEKKFVELFAQTLELEDSSLLSIDTVFRDLEQWDSLAYLSLIAAIDEEFGVVIDGKDFKNFKTIGDIFDYIQKHK